MKVHLSINNDPINNYVNITSAGGEGRVACDFRNMDHICQAACAEEFYAPDMLDYVHGSQIIHVLKYWVSRLRKGGKIIVGGTDLFEFCKGVVSGQLNCVEANKVIFNDLNISPFLKQGLFVWSDIELMLTELGLKVIHKRISNRKFTIEAHRI